MTAVRIESECVSIPHVWQAYKHVDRNAYTSDVTLIVASGEVRVIPGGKSYQALREGSAYVIPNGVPFDVMALEPYSVVLIIQVPA